jgi:hypothetical protein
VTAEEQRLLLGAGGELGGLLSACFHYDVLWDEYDYGVCVKCGALQEQSDLEADILRGLAAIWAGA